MTPSTRLLIALLLVELGLAGLWYWLVAGIMSGDFRTAVPAGQAITTISSTIGGAMGLFAVLALVVWVVRGRRRHAG